MSSGRPLPTPERPTAAVARPFGLPALMSSPNAPPCRHSQERLSTLWSLQSQNQKVPVPLRLLSMSPCCKKKIAVAFGRGKLDCKNAQTRQMCLLPVRSCAFHRLLSDAFLGTRCFFFCIHVKFASDFAGRFRNGSQTEAMLHRVNRCCGHAGCRICFPWSMLVASSVLGSCQSTGRAITLFQT